jgi:hypothetical protein
MTHYRLRQANKAQGRLRELRELMKGYWQTNDEARKVVEEAEKLIERK